MPRIAPLTAEARMNQQLLATIDKYMRLANITSYGELGPRIGIAETTARARIRNPSKFTFEEFRKLARVLHIPPEDMLAALYDKK